MGDKGYGKKDRKERESIGIGSKGQEVGGKG